MLRVNVRGGTEAGRRVRRECRAWRCMCPATRQWHAARITDDGTTPIGRKQSGARYSCPDCGARRP